MKSGLRVAVVIPALNEEQAIGRVLDEIPAYVDEVVVADNGSTDATALVARERGARVVHEPRRGYGSACLAAIGALREPDVVVFLDADFSDHPREMDRLLAPIARDEADLVIGSRVRGRADPGSLTVPQRFGNALACALLRVVFRVEYTDLGPFRAIRHESLRRLGMDDRNYGWTVQMQARAARQGLRATEVPVSYRRRIGRSKISGTVRGILGAGTKILMTIGAEALRAPHRRARAEERLVVFAREPESGRAKTRLIPLLGAEGAADLYAEMLRTTVKGAGRLARSRGTTVEVRATSSGRSARLRRIAVGLPLRSQGGGDLGARMRRSVRETLAGSARRVVLVGSDCPLLGPSRLSEAFDALSTHDVVLGPAADGGYYLLGVKADHPELYEDMPWGGRDVLRRALEAADRAGLRVRLLDELPDVDRPEDVGVWARARRPRAGTRPRLSVVIPTLDEEARLGATLASVLAGDDLEIIVADGGSADRTVDLARSFGARVVVTSPSRGRQLNAGAALARADTLLFLHADTRLPPDYADVVERTLARPQIAAGAFDLAIDGPGFALRCVEAAVLVRARVLGRPYGDQALFLRARVFESAGGFPEMPFMEDYVILQRLRRFGRVRTVRSAVRTSDRSWRSRGVLRTTLNHQRILLRHHLGLALGSR